MMPAASTRNASLRLHNCEGLAVPISSHLSLRICQKRHPIHPPAKLTCVSNQQIATYCQQRSCRICYVYWIQSARHYRKSRHK
ncbi:hypothetical protein K443DRAFT_263813 [Laccaria amethystina LaAM-08-1]|uniref:Uncharacterized protein n=1 Tax=Laccaria amethystina LaAM-08-1 TaxID=1095629 RepID=A0A0C9XY55_9AGAR|nr:hypothetical protein K443DRAFT_263813 [Laccaria amethystina LaAM-08-1]